MLLHRSHRSALPIDSIKASKVGRQWPNGQVIPLIAGVIAVLLGALALGTDVAVHYYNWEQIQKAADSAVLAGANSLPDNPSQAMAIAQQYAVANGVKAAEITSDTVAANDLSITMTVQRTVPYFFGHVLGLTNVTMKVSATAAPQPPTSTVGAPSSSAASSGSSGGGSYTPASCTNTGDCQVLPIGLDHNTVYSDGEQITLQQGQVGPGNWDLLALGGVGGSNLRTNIAVGYSGMISVGDWVLTEPGKKVGPVDQGFQDRLDAAATVDPNGTYSTHAPTNPRVIVLPIVDWEDQNGRTDVQVDAFATVWLDSYSGGNVTVHFISQVIANSFGDPSAPNFGGRGHPMLIR
jgi:Putative Flp pilus-assembly TadE/G-like